MTGLTRKYTALLLMAAALSGCASQILEGYVGKSISEPMMDMGRPENVIELSENRRAYQWRETNSDVIPITTPSTATIAGPGGWTSVTTTHTGYIPYTTDCLYTVTATKAGNDWIVDGFRKPSLECE